MTLTNAPRFPLNSFNEWGRLREVVVGNPFPDVDYLADFSFYHFHFDNLRSHIDMVRGSAVTDKSASLLKFRPDYLEELKEDIEGFVSALQDFGVNVLRPKQIDPDKMTLDLPYWRTSVWPALNVRDRVLITGNTFVETTPCIRARYLETDLLKEIFYGFFQQGATWLSMPRPILTDTSFDVSYIEGSPYKSASRELVSHRENCHYDVGFEMLMDAANCLRIGKDIIVNVADQNQELAFQWLVRTLGHTFTFHRLESLTDNHIDSYVIIIRPGLLLVRNAAVLDKLPSFMRKWEYIVAPEPNADAFPTYDVESLAITSRYIDTNVLSVDSNTVIANSLNPNLIRALEQRGVEVIPVRHRHRRLFGGGFHCFTLDTNRDSELVSYA